MISAVLPSGVHRLDLVGVAGVDAAALQLRGRGEQVGVGQPLLAQQRELLICSTWANCLLASSTPRCTSAITPGSAARSVERARSRCRAPWPTTGATSASSTSSAETNLRLSPMAQAWPTSGIVFRRALEVGRADVLAARRDDQLLLAVDDPQVAVVVEHTDVARVQPAVDEGLGRLLRVLVVARGTRCRRGRSPRRRRRSAPRSRGSPARPCPGLMS